MHFYNIGALEYKPRQFPMPFDESDAALLTNVRERTDKRLTTVSFLLVTDRPPNLNQHYIDGRNRSSGIDFRLVNRVQESKTLTSKMRVIAVVAAAKDDKELYFFFRSVTFDVNKRRVLMTMSKRLYITSFYNMRNMAQLAISKKLVGLAHPFLGFASHVSINQLEADEEIRNLVKRHFEATLDEQGAKEAFLMQKCDPDLLNVLSSGNGDGALRFVAIAKLMGY